MLKNNLKLGVFVQKKLTNDYVNPKQLEKKLKQKTSLRINWIKKHWKVTESHNLILLFEGQHLPILTSKKINKCKIGEIWGNKTFDTLEKAKISVFNGIEYLKVIGNMNKFWKYCNLTILIFQIIICSLGTFYKHIAFGWGLGDLIWYGLMYILLIVHLVLTLKAKTKPSQYFRVLTIVFFLTTTYICLKATIWRGVEYRWNGNIFYK